jgi:hypothetical protein
MTNVLLVIGIALGAVVLNALLNPPSEPPFDDEG